MFFVSVYILRSLKRDVTGIGKNFKDLGALCAISLAYPSCHKMAAASPATVSIFKAGERGKAKGWDQNMCFLSFFLSFLIYHERTSFLGSPSYRLLLGVHSPNWGYMATLCCRES